MKLGYVTVSGRGRIDDLVAEVATAFTERGLRLAGSVRARPADPDGHPCDMDIRVLPDGPRFGISQPLGSAATGCRLDGGVIEAIASAVEARLPGADLLIVNKFGKLEAEGRGLRPAIVLAMEMGIPALVGVSEANAADFLAFSGGIGAPLGSDPGAILDWYDQMEGSERFAPAAWPGRFASRVGLRSAAGPGRGSRASERSGRPAR